LKKIITIGLLFFLAASSPVNAYDFGAAGYIAAIGATAIGVAAFVGAAPALATLAIASAVMGITFDKTESTGSVIVAQISPSAKFETPSGWTAPTSGQSQPSPPASQPSSLEYKISGFVGGDIFAASASAVCASAVGKTMTPYTVASTVFNAFSLSCELKDSSGWSFASASIVEVTRCPVGYTASGDSCSLSQPNLVMKPADGACGIQRIANSFSADTQDPDCAIMPASVSVSPSTITQTRPDGSQKSVTINADGSVTATDSKPDTSSNTTQTNTTQVSAPDASGNSQVSGQGTGSTNGIGTANTGTPTPGFDKTGLATETTLGGIKSDTGAIKDALTGAGSDSSMSGEKSAFGSALDGLIGMFSDEGSRSEGGLSEGFDMGGYLPTQCGCTPLTMTIMGHSASYDWCAPIAIFKSVFSWVLGLMTAWYVFTLFRLGGSK